MHWKFFGTLGFFRKINEFLKKCYDKLDTKGNLVIQIINFHPFLQVDDDYLGNLPTIKNEKWNLYENISEMEIL